MSFAVSRYDHPQVQGGTNPTIVVLEESAGHRVEVWPAFGMNAFRWVTPGPADLPLELLYADPGLFTEGRPSRSGVPVLFPFPNRIAGGRFNWAGKTWELPLNDSTGRNSIHGFACRSPWEVLDAGSDSDSAWVTGRHRSRNAAGNWWHAPWPADYEVRLTVRLGVDFLRLEAEVDATGAPLPFGLGYHPYFTIPFTPDLEAEQCLVQVPATANWELNEAIPTGQVLPLDAPRDLNTPRPFGELHLDDIFTDLPANNGTAAGLRWCGQIMGAPGQVLQILADEQFRDLVVFNPPHRQAFCIEPYTCPTDAVHLTEAGVDCGWRTLTSGETARFVVEFRLLRNTTLQPRTSKEEQA